MTAPRFLLMRTKKIVFDFGNVIAKYDVDAMLGTFFLSDEEKKLFKAKVFDDPKWRDCDRGFGYRDTVFHETLNDFSPKLQEVFCSLVARYDFEVQFMPFNAGIEETIKELKDNGYNLYLLSNIGLNFHVFNMKMPVFRLFDGLFPSCDYGVIKPEKEIYDTFFRKFSLIPEECLFIDDSPENVEASIKAGMPAFMYNALSEDVSSLRKKLSEYGIVIGK